jgi:hypothetical protein
MEFSARKMRHDRIVANRKRRAEEKQDEHKRLVAERMRRKAEREEKERLAKEERRMKAAVQRAARLQVYAQIERKKKVRQKKLDEADRRAKEKALATERAKNPLPDWFRCRERGIHRGPQRTGNAEREAAWIAGKSQYPSNRRCKSCGGIVRLVCDNKCSECERRRSQVHQRRKTEGHSAQERCFRNAINRGYAKSKQMKAAFIGTDLGGFVKHIESQFTKGMRWSNYGDFWELDHDIPLRAFNMDAEGDVKICVHYTNIRPLECGGNREKASVSDSLLSDGLQDADY